MLDPRPHRIPRTPPRATPARGARARVARPAALLLAGALGYVACSQDAGEALAELERLAFVPSGECVLFGRSGLRLSCANDRALLVDRFEVTRAAWRAWTARQPALDPTLAEVVASWPAQTSTWPASFMTQAEARSFAASRGMRLLSAREWLRVACDTRGLAHPWGNREASSVANTLNLGLRHPLPVGTFEQGRTPLATYDMTGNVWEWVEDPILSLPGEEDSDPGIAWAMGGSYLSRLRRIHDLDREEGHLVLDEQSLDPRTRSIDVGLRCAADAEAYLTANARRLGGEAERERLLAIGAAWGHNAVPLLADLAGRGDAAPGLSILLEGARR